MPHQHRQACFTQAIQSNTTALSHEREASFCTFSNWTQASVRGRTDAPTYYVRTQAGEWMQA